MKWLLRPARGFAGGDGTLRIVDVPWPKVSDHARLLPATSAVTRLSRILKNDIQEAVQHMSTLTIPTAGGQRRYWQLAHELTK